MHGALALVLVRAVVDVELGHEVSDEGVAPQREHVGAHDGEDLPEEGLDEAVESAGLAEAGGLADEEEVEVAQVLLDLGPGNVGERGQVDGGAGDHARRFRLNGKKEEQKKIHSVGSILVCMYNKLHRKISLRT